jgi:hypothetical protein
MTIQATNFLFNDTPGGISFYVPTDQAQIGDGETKDIPIQDSVGTVVQLVRRTLTLNAVGLNDAIMATIQNRFDTSKVQLIQQSYVAFDIVLGAIQLFEMKPTRFTPSVPTLVNGIAVYDQQVSLEYSSGAYT